MPNHEAGLDQRLRALSKASADWMSSEPGRRDMALRARAARAQAQVDMGSAALDRRLHAMARAAALCLELAKLRHE
jgi:hypothetical protein